VSNNEPDDFGHISESAHFDREWNNDKFRQARRSFVTHEPNALVCSRCPNRDAHDYQFRMTLRAILRNAPDWVLNVLSPAPETFFFDVDFELSPVEMGALRDHRSRITRPSQRVKERLELAARQHDGNREHILALLAILEAGPPLGSRSSVPELASRGWFPGTVYARLRRILSIRRTP
jgi:hypothetical protein